MTLPTLQTLISLDHLHCHGEGDFILSDDEPYLWTAFFKVDGETAVLDLIGELSDDELTERDLYLSGTCTFVPAPGNHGNLGDTDVEAGDDVGIPSAVGESGFTLKPIPVTDRARKKLLDKYGQALLPEVLDFVGGGATIGVVAALNEEWGTPANAVEAGHVTFNRTLEDGINGFLFQDGGSRRKDDLKDKLGHDKPKLLPGDKAALKQKVIAAAIAAVKETDRVHPPDKNVNAQEFLFDLAGLKNKGVQEIDHRLQYFIPAPTPTPSPGGGAGGIGLPNSPTEVLTADYELLGEALAIEPGPIRYASLRRSEEYGTPAAAGAPFACLVPALGAKNIVYRDTEYRLHELSRDANGKTGTANLTELADNAPLADGNPFAYVETATGLLIVIYRGKDDGNVYCIYGSGNLAHENLTAAVEAKADGNPVGYFTPATNTHHVIYRGDKHLHVLRWAGAESAHHDDMTKRAGAGAPPAVGDPSAFVDPTRGLNLVVYRGEDAHIHDIYWRIDTSVEPEVRPENLSGTAGTPPALGDPVAYYTAANNTTQVTYRGVDNHIYDLWCVGDQRIQGRDLSAAAGAPDTVAVSDPAAFYSAGTNTKHVIYREANDHLYELAWVPPDGTPARVDLTLQALARRAVDKPAAFTVDGTNQKHVIYRTADNQIHEIFWPGKTWETTGSGSTWETTGSGSTWHTAGTLHGGGGL